MGPASRESGVRRPGWATALTALGASGLVLATLAGGSPATADSGPGAWADSDGRGYIAGASYTVISTFGGTVTARASGTGPPPVCYWFDLGKTAADFDADPWLPGGNDGYEGGETGLTNRSAREAVPTDLAQRLAQEAAGDGGTYYAALCNGGRWTGHDRDAFFDHANDFFRSNPVVRYVSPSDPLPPPPPLTVSELVTIVEEYIEPPAPVVGRSPAGASLVNLDTWIWAEGDTFSVGTVTATSGPNSVTVTVTPRGLDLSAPHATQTAACLDGGTPWTGQAESVDPTCALTFARAPGGRADLPLTVTSRWTADWAGSDGTGGTLSPTAVSTTVDVTVQEVQTLVTEAG